MPFYDRAKITVKAGDGGAGSASMRREKYVSRGGPDGGDGGRGGHVFLRANPELNTLLPFYYRKQFVATNGGQGAHRKQHGANGADIYIDVPPGTQVRIISTDPLEADLITVTEADLIEPGQVLRVARGGKGGLGNVHFATSTHQAPRIAEKGEPGDQRTLELELKIIADVGLVGYPNAGKSTLLAAASAARPEIADYPFTTLEPVLGVVSVDDDTFVMADIPGLIEGASEGKGLGLEFLRHVERCRLLHPCARRRVRPLPRRHSARTPPRYPPTARAQPHARLRADQPGAGPVQPLAGREAADRGRQQDGSP